jgi:uncharacterized cupin superfamily protein
VPRACETAVVTTGSVTLVCDGVAHELAEGDAVTFDADLPHHFENNADADARFYAVVAAGLRRS